jgi:hypothetical protein
VKVTDITVTKNEDGSKTIVARVEATTKTTVNYALPTFTNLGMTDKINVGSAKFITTSEHVHTEVIQVEITPEQARELVEESSLFHGEDEMKKRYEQQTPTVTIIRL